MSDTFTTQKRTGRTDEWKKQETKIKMAAYRYNFLRFTLNVQQKQSSAEQ